MQHELQVLFHRPVDLITKRALERSPNWILRNEILSTAKVVFRQEKVVDSAILYQLIVIGEAVKRLSAEFRAVHAEIP